MKMILLVSDGTPKYYWCGKMVCHTYMARSPNIDIIVNMPLEAEKTVQVSLKSIKSSTIQLQAIQMAYKL